MWRGKKGADKERRQEVERREEERKEEGKSEIQKKRRKTRGVERGKEDEKGRKNWGAHNDDEGGITERTQEIRGGHKRRVWRRRARCKERAKEVRGGRSRKGGGEGKQKDKCKWVNRDEDGRMKEVEERRRRRRRGI